MEPIDPELIAKAKQGSTEAFGELYDKFADRIFKYIKLKVQDPAQAEDILQETFIKAWRGIPNFDLSKPNFSAWIYKIAHNSVNDYYRKYYRTPEILEIDENIDIATLEFSSGDEIDHKLYMAGVKNSLDELPKIYKTVIELRFIQDLSISEVSEILNKSNLSVRLIQHRALKKIKDKVKKKYDLGFKKI